MKELYDILAAIEAARGQSIALATVVGVTGSAYRRPGARMLILADGRTIGGISGGCLEADVAEHARKVISTRTPVVVSYDTSRDDDLIFGVGQGCNGIVDVLIEPIDAHDPNSPIRFIERAVMRREAVAIGTVIRAAGIEGVAIGQRIAVSDGNVVHDALTSPTARQRVLPDLKSALAERSSRSAGYSLAGGSFEVFIEVLLPPQSLVIFGAGSDAMPLVSFAKGLGWHVTVADARESAASPARFPFADVVFAAPARQLVERATLGEQSAVVLMTHHFRNDEILLGQLLRTPLRYLGILGPRRRTGRLLKPILDADASLGAGAQRLHSPIGLDLGAESPEEIALAIIAEIQLTVRRRTGQPLRERSGPIHPRPASSGEHAATPEQSAKEGFACPTSAS